MILCHCSICQCFNAYSLRQALQRALYESPRHPTSCSSGIAVFDCNHSFQRELQHSFRTTNAATDYVSFSACFEVCAQVQTYQDGQMVFKLQVLSYESARWSRGVYYSAGWADTRRVPSSPTTNYYS